MSQDSDITPDIPNDDTANVGTNILNFLLLGNRIYKPKHNCYDGVDVDKFNRS